MIVIALEVCADAGAAALVRSAGIATGRTVIVIFGQIDANIVAIGLTWYAGRSTDAIKT